MGSRKPAPVGSCPNPVEVELDGGRKAFVRCKSRRCESCGQLWAGDQVKRLVANLESYSGPMVMGSLTAPGSDVLGSPAQQEAWNQAAPTHWRLLQAQVQQLVRRDCGEAANVLCWVWEYQRRGALHKHFVLGVGTARERHAAMLYLRYMDQLRAGYGFGFMDRGRWCPTTRRRTLREMTGLHAGRYLAKYLAKRDRSTGRPMVSETVLHRDVPPLVVYVTRRLTAVTGVTMRSLREWRYFVATSLEVPLEVVRELLAATYGHDQVDGLIAGANAPPLAA
jgi:hypothetical protein